MQSKREIETVIRNLEIPTSQGADEWILADAINALDAAKRRKADTHSSHLWRKIMKNPWTILTTAAAALFAIVAGIQYFGPDESSEITKSTTDTVAKKESDNDVTIIATPHDLVPPNEPEKIPLKLVLPKPSFYTVPFDFSKVDRLEPRRKAPRESILVPEGTKNLSLGKTVTSSNKQLNVDTLAQITDGDKEGSKSSIIELGSGVQWVQIDLDTPCNIYAIIFWHFHRYPRVYFDVAVQVSNDPDFIEVITLFNNDHNNSLGLGVGNDLHYIDTYEGKLLDTQGVQARYVRLYSNGNNNNDLNHYTEVEVYGVDE